MVSDVVISKARARMRKGVMMSNKLRIWQYVSIVVIASASGAPAAETTRLSGNQVRDLARTALTENATELPNLISTGRSWAEISGRPLSSLKTHYEVVNEKPVHVFDGWEDRPALSVQYPGVEQRVIADGPGSFTTNDFVFQLLRPDRPARLKGTTKIGGQQYFVLESLGFSAGLQKGWRIESCAAATVAALLIDMKSYFPVHVRTTVVTADSCQPGASADVTNRVGTVMQFDYSSMTEQDKCGRVHKVYALQRSEVASSFGGGTLTLYAGQIAQRTFPGLPAGTLKSIKQAADFKVFVVGACVSYPQ